MVRGPTDAEKDEMPRPVLDPPLVTFFQHRHTREAHATMGAAAAVGSGSLKANPGEGQGLRQSESRSGAVDRPGCVSMSVRLLLIGRSAVGGVCAGEARSDESSPAGGSPSKVSRSSRRGILPEGSRSRIHPRDDDADSTSQVSPQGESNTAQWIKGRPPPPPIQGAASTFGLLVFVSQKGVCVSFLWRICPARGRCAHELSHLTVSRLTSDCGPGRDHNPQPRIVPPAVRIGNEQRSQCRLPLREADDFR